MSMTRVVALLACSLLTVTGCVHLPYVAPRARVTEAERAAATVRVWSFCDESPDPIWGDVWAVASYAPSPGSLDFPASAVGVGMGTVLNDRMIVTAAHVVECAMIPKVVVRFADGKHRRVYVEHVDRDKDIAVLEAFGSSNFGEGIAPPIINYYDAGSYLPTAHAVQGKSGSAAYDASGSLVGLAIVGYPCLATGKLGCGADIARLWDSFVCRNPQRYRGGCEGHASR